PYLLEDIETADARHHDVQADQVERNVVFDGLAEKAKSFFAVAGHFRRSEWRKKLLQYELIGAIVFYNQCAHRIPAADAAVVTPRPSVSSEEESAGSSESIYSIGRSGQEALVFFPAFSGKGRANCARIPRYSSFLS